MIPNFSAIVAVLILEFSFIISIIASLVLSELFGELFGELIGEPSCAAELS